MLCNDNCLEKIFARVDWVKLGMHPKRSLQVITKTGNGDSRIGMDFFGEKSASQ